MVEELKACADIAAQYKEHEDPFLLVELQEMAQELFLDHGQALVEALVDAERYRWLRDEGTSDGQWEVLQESNGMMRVHLFADELDAAIDFARTKASAGGGVNER